MTTWSRITAFAVIGLSALTATTAAFAHAHVSPPVALAKAGQVFTLAVPTEKAGATTTTIELTPPSGFSIDSFVPAPGWKRTVQKTGSGDSAVVTKVTWSGGAVPTGEDAAFSFLGRRLVGQRVLGHAGAGRRGEGVVRRRRLVDARTRRGGARHPRARRRGGRARAAGRPFGRVSAAWLKLLVSVAALGVGIAAVVVIVLLLRSTS
jgi:hypothetical protein